ncbi:hypothetical protein [Micromonospora sp. HM5-17]|jgi:hypothetical protein|uniref:hypothetical protein n=1 Tax=Micromonospora sp. HM5-17 TaxID=2487710 RepID=UPI000F48031D|nr:hypothetical protein [Micromonospora sp. HM5-17]ROT32790.1 hypothetical protein EF879_06240 [Micromonospora sp. HM5-17]
MDQQPELSADVPRAWDRPVFSVPILAFLSLIGGQLPSFSTAANLYSIGLGGALAWVGLSPRFPRRAVPQRLTAGAGWWLVPVLIFGVFEAATFLLGSRDDFPTFSKLADPLLEGSLVRSAAYFAWLWAFWGLVRR